MQKIMDAIQRAGRPLPDVEMALMTGMDLAVVKRTVENARAMGYLMRIPATFQVTQKGLARMEVKTVKKPVKTPKPVKKAVVREEVDEWPATRPVDVRAVIANQHPLAAAWGREVANA